MNNRVLSIGGTCDPRIAIKRELGYSKATGYMTCPFDLLFSSFEAVAHHIKTDFSDFFDGLHITPHCPSNCSVCVSGPFAGRGLISNKYGVVFEHESPTHAHLFRGARGLGGADFEWANAPNDTNLFIRNDFAELKAKYKVRIDNFRNAIKGNKRIVLVRRNMPGEANPTGVKRRDLIESLEKRYVGKEFVLFCGAQGSLRDVVSRKHCPI